MSGLDIRDRSREVLVLKSLPYKEQDRLLTLLSPEQGADTQATYYYIALESIVKR